MRDADLHFTYWFNRKMEIIGQNRGSWRGKYNSNPDPLHKNIDIQLALFRPYINPNYSRFDRELKRLIIINPTQVNEIPKIPLLDDKNSSMFEIVK